MVSNWKLYYILCGKLCAIFFLKNHVSIHNSYRLFDIWILFFGPFLQLLDTRQILVAAVNGRASGLGVGLLPYFDIVYASDKADFSLEYARLGHIPEAFASQTKLADCRELMLNLTKFTATMAKEAGLVSDVILPNKFLEEIVPKLESLELMSKNGLRILSKCLMKSMKERVYKVIEDETKELITQWSSLEFAKFMKSYIKSGHLSFI